MQEQLNELKRMAASRVDVKTFYERLLREISDVTKAEAGLVWNCSQPPYRMLCDHRVNSSPNLRAAIQHQKHVALLEAAIQRNQPILVPPRAESTERLPVIALGPIQRGGEIEMIELFLPPDGSEQDFKQWLTCLHEFCQVARELNSTPPRPAKPQVFTAQANHPTFDTPRRPDPHVPTAGTSTAEPSPRPPRPEVQPAAAEPIRVAAISPTSPVFSAAAQPASVPFVAAPHPARPAAASVQMQTASANLVHSLNDVEQYVLQLHQNLDPQTTMSRVANETRRFLNADRVSVLQWHRGSAKVRAVSGQPSVNQRSSTIQLLRRLAQRVLPLGETFWYPMDKEKDQRVPLPAEIEHPLNEYLTASTVRSLIIVPISDQSATSAEDPDSAKVERRWIGGIVVEKFDALWDRGELTPTIELVSRQAGSALRNVQQHRSLFLFPIWNALGKSRVVVAARNLRRSALVFLALLALAGALIFVPAPFRISCNGVLLPQGRQNVFAQVDGDVSQVHVDHGALVAANAEVVTLTNETLLRQRQEIAGKIKPLEEQLAAIDSNILDRPRNDSQAPTDDRANLEQGSLRASLESARRQLAIIDEQIKFLSVRSPMAGQVLSWDVRQELMHKPVRRGDLLLEVADVNGPWELELKLPDRRIGHVLRAQAESDKPLPVSFVLAADPNIAWSGEIISIAKITQDDSVDGQTIRVEVAFDHSTLDIKQARSGVLAKVHCGYRPLGYVWLHDVFEFFQSKVFFRLW